ncbi:D-alanyl-D-alanine carboxypeptidase family protein [Enterocloster clostridioformis]|nr:D-alanyl-D-alanine carboxypeptidase family protein [Enterocloster clostridioformis]
MQIGFLWRKQCQEKSIQKIQNEPWHMSYG